MAKKKKNPRKLGLQRQRQSVRYILRHPEIYGIEAELGDRPNKQGTITLRSPRIEVAGVAHFQGDFFSVEYAKDKDGKPLKAGWDIVTMPGMDDFPIWLIQVKSHPSFQMSQNIKYVTILFNFKVPPCVKKELHIWHPNKAVPERIDLNASKDNK